MSEPFIPTWRDRALCRETDPELFYVKRGGDPRPAKRVCAHCTVKAECLDEAMSYPPGEDWGIRGGLSAQERRKLRRDGTLAPVTILPLTVATPEQPQQEAA